jgi:hypothetical protein
MLLAGAILADEPPPAELIAQRRLLETADQRGPQAVNEAKRRFESARALVEDDRPLPGRCITPTAWCSSGC